MSSSPTPLEDRLDRLEHALATISKEVASIRAELGSARSETPANATVDPVAPQENQQSKPEPTSKSRRPGKERASSLDLERLVGRYGMLAISVIAVVAAVGTFLSWAYANGYLRLSPPMRVVIGLAFAGALGIWGFSLRKRERSFGSTILALALVIVQVCAYAAGPGFALVPTWAAFAGTALVSWLLAFFAHGENDEPLWCVGFGGAALAPFVTSDGSGKIYPLLVYGLVTLLPACFAISQRNWPVGWRVFYAATALFSLVGADIGYRTGTLASMCAFGFPFVVMMAGVVPFAPQSRKRAAMRWLAFLGALASVRTQVYFDSRSWFVAGVLLGAVALWLFLLDHQSHLPQSSLVARTREFPRLLNWIDVAAIPLLITFEAADGLRNHGLPIAVYAAATAAFLVFAVRRDVNSMRDGAAFSALVTAVAVAILVPLEEPFGRTAAFVALGLLALFLHWAKPSLSWLFGGLAVLAGCAGVAATTLVDRKPYSFNPFTTEPSAVALTVLLALIAVARFWPTLRIATRTSMGERPEWTYAANAKLFVRGISIAPWVWAFVWVMLELSMVYSASTSTLLLVTYFASTAVLCVGVGRARHSARLRQVGLGLALVATCTAFYGATSYFDIAARIIAYLVTSAFLLGIAYWYRQTGAVENPRDVTA